MSGWTPWRRDRTRELPGSLCDETPQTLHADGPTWPQKAPRGTMRPPLVTVQQETPPAPEIGRWQPRDDEQPTGLIEAPQDLTQEEAAELRRRFFEASARTGIETHERRKLEDLYLQACEQLREVTADRDTLDAANGRLITERRELLAEIGLLRHHAAAVVRENDALRLALTDLGRQLHRSQDGDTVPLTAVDAASDTGSDDNLLVPWRRT